MISYNEISSNLGTMWSPLNIIDCLGFCGDPKALVLTLVMMVVSLMVIPHTTKMAKMPI